MKRDNIIFVVFMFLILGIAGFVLQCTTVSHDGFLTHPEMKYLMIGTLIWLLVNMLVLITLLIKELKETNNEHYKRERV